jgi:putative ABC transport system permease protein
MKVLDLVRLILGNLSRRKARVALTAIGVVIGTAAVVILVSLAIGLQKNANEQLYGIGDLTQIQVMPAYEMMEGGGGMVVQVGGPGGKGGQPQPARLLTNSALDEFRAIPGVESVIPREYLMTGVLIKYQKMEGGSGIIGVDAPDLASLRLEATEGGTELGRGTVVIVPWWQIPLTALETGQEPPATNFMDNNQLVISKYDSGNEIRKNLSVRVTGVLKKHVWGLIDDLFPLDQIKALNEWAQGRRINYNKEGYSQVVVKVQDVEQVLDISDQITQMGFQAFTPQSFVQGINNFYVILQFIFGGVGAIALLVAAIGIANTMAMSILERTREIGLMKAVGATNRDVLAIFLGEAAGIGFIGGLGGVVIGWLAGQGINVIALVYLANQAGQQGGAPPSIAVYTPVWLPVFALVFSTIIGMISGLYPALRAATMIPVLALKYE